MQISTIVFPLLIILFSFLEVLVFNEEVLLALCFLSFVFYAYCSIGSSVEDTFKDQTTSVETKFLFVFGNEFNLLKLTLDSFKKLSDIMVGYSYLTPFLSYCVSSKLVAIKGFAYSHIITSMSSVLLDIKSQEMQLKTVVQQSSIPMVMFSLISFIGSNGNLFTNQLVLTQSSRTLLNSLSDSATLRTVALAKNI